MKIGIISDIHDNIWKLESALHMLRGADVLICCGDLCSPFVVDRLAGGFRGPIHVVFGNNDGDRYRITRKAAGHNHFHLHGEFVELELDGQRFAVNHFDDIGRALAGSGVYDVVCFGHNHLYEVARIGKTLLINPGEVMGGLSKPQLSSCAAYDTVAQSVQKIEV